MDPQVNGPRPVVVEPGSEDRLWFSVTLGSATGWGWAKVIDCPDNRLLVIAVGSSREQADSVAPLVAAGRCLRDGEAPQVWPDTVDPDAKSVEP